MRTCGTCSLCCKVAAIRELNKPAGVWCQYAKPGQGCTIHGQHPRECQSFQCAWLNRLDMDESWKPVISKLVVRIEGAGILVHVDPDAKGAWKKEPYYSVLKRLSQGLEDGSAHVLVYEGFDTTVIFPEEDLHVGMVYGGDQVAVGYRKTPLTRRPWARVDTADGGQTEYLGAEQITVPPRPVA